MDGVESKALQPLYDRLGGDETFDLILGNFYDEILEDKELFSLFRGVSLGALHTPHLRMFRAVLGPEENKPDLTVLRNKVFSCHSRLFRERGLNAHHFDKVAVCLVKGLNTLQINQKLVDEVVENLVPLRCMFAYGAVVAEQEKKMTSSQICLLPTASVSTMGLDKAVALPGVDKVEHPSWLTDILKKQSSQGSARLWVCELANRFAEFLELDSLEDLSYSKLLHFFAAFLQLAFLPKNQDPSKLLRTVRFPSGLRSSPLSQATWALLITEFVNTCKSMLLKIPYTVKATVKLHKYDGYFPITKVRGSGGTSHYPEAMPSGPMSHDPKQKARASKKSKAQPPKPESAPVATPSPKKRQSTSDNSNTGIPTTRSQTKVPAKPCFARRVFGMNRRKDPRRISI